MASGNERYDLGLGPYKVTSANADEIYFGAKTARQIRVQPDSLLEISGSDTDPRLFKEPPRILTASTPNISRRGSPHPIEYTPYPFSRQPTL